MLTRTSRPRPRPVAAAWDLWLVRLLARLGLSVGPRLVVGTAIVLSTSVGLLLLAAIQAWGEAAVVNVRAVDGFFGTGTAGLTNATHLVFLVALPLILLSLVGLLNAAGFNKPEISLLRRDRTVWSALGLEARHVVLTHEALPRLPLLVLCMVPVLAVGSLANLTSAERDLVVVLAATALVVELLRLTAAAYRSTTPIRGEARVGLRAVGGMVGAGLIGAGAGMALNLTLPLVTGSPDRSVPVARAATFVTDHAALVLTGLAVVAVVALVGLGRICASRRGVGRHLITDPPAAWPVAGRALGGVFPLVGPARLLGVWAAPELRVAILVAAALAVVQPELSELTSQVALIVAVTAMMASSLTRLAPWGLSASLMRLRHHVELGAKPLHQGAQLALVTLLAAAPMWLVLYWVAVHVGTDPSRAAGLILWPVLAALMADAVVARPGSELTENRLLVLALVQSIITMIGWVSFSFHLLAGWPLVVFLIGGFCWLSMRRQLVWLPRTKW